MFQFKIHNMKLTRLLKKRKILQSKKIIPAKRIALIGNPNCGKTVIFNALTGSKQKIGNWAGVTVEQKSGSFILDNRRYEIIDLPGIYSLSVISEQASLDERITCSYLLSDKPDLIINVIDASNLERHLYLTAQLLELNIPMILALTMTDISQQRKITIDTENLAKILGVSVLPLIAHRGRGIAQLRQAITRPHSAPHSIHYPLTESIQQACQNLQKRLTNHTAQTWLALRLLEEDQLAKTLVNAELAHHACMISQDLKNRHGGEEIDLLIADARYQWVYALLKHVVNKQTIDKTSTERMDNFVLNRWLGLPIFLLIMYGMFVFSVNVGGAFQDFFNISSEAIFVDGFDTLLQSIHAPAWIVACLAHGLGQGINTTITFAPVIAALFFALSILEDSGYLARAAFVIDRFMASIGLPGKAFIPLIIGLGCNVPTIMATRTLSTQRDRILTVMMAPFISCSARLAVYSVFVSAFFPSCGARIIFSLYLIGFVMAIITAFFLRKTTLASDATPMILELPNYHWPHWRSVFRHSWQRLKLFLSKAGRFIIPVCVLLGCLNSINTSGQLIQGEVTQDSLLSVIGKKITPLFAPLGLTTDNWPATVGLVSGLLAKEVVVGTLNTLYVQEGRLHSHNAENKNLKVKLVSAFISIPTNLAKLAAALRNPLKASAPDDSLDQGVYGLMVQHFDGRVGAYAYLLFILLYFPCLSTLAIMRREIGNGWAYFSITWSMAAAFCLSILFYQTARIMRHPLPSILWIASITCIIAILTLRIHNTTRMQTRLAHELC